jgi:hypothetical protein
MPRYTAPLLAIALLAGCASQAPSQETAAAKPDGACIRLTGSNLCKAPEDTKTSNVRVIPGDALRRAGPEAIGAPPTPGPE